MCDGVEKHPNFTATFQDKWLMTIIKNILFKQVDVDIYAEYVTHTHSEKYLKNIYTQSKKLFARAYMLKKIWVKYR